MKRVVITGVGIVSSLGNNKDEVTDSLKNGRSGIVFAPEYEENGMRSQVHGAVKNLDFKEHIDRKQLRFMGDAAAYSYIAMKQAVEDSGLTEDQFQIREPAWWPVPAAAPTPMQRKPSALPKSVALSVLDLTW